MPDDRARKPVAPTVFAGGVTPSRVNLEHGWNDRSRILILRPVQLIAPKATADYIHLASGCMLLAHFDQRLRGNTQPLMILSVRK
jgi:hypothetical protein